MQLTEWLTHYIKFKDCMKKQITSVNVQKDTIIVEEKKETKTYYVHPHLAAISNKKIKGKTFFVCENSQENIKTLLDQWQQLITQKQLIILFVHPSTNDVWLINPSVHHNITEEKNLKEGIQAMHESIPQA